MHEQSLINDLIHQIEKLAREQQAKRVTCVRVKLGAFSHCSREHLQEHFDQGSQGTLVEGARVEIEQLTDTEDPLAQEIILESFDIED